jgi:hypothetical protein
VSLKPWVCQALRFLKLHHPDCHRCAARDCYMIIRYRLMELNEHATQRSSPSPNESTTSSQNDAA